eukprot:c8859_g1_i1.p1 GENE.c8859_g1_i1~~c8859_g1_i1.p1  ORF type:complete len:1625 (+),score=443.39 c8859_g1_i1:129-5003(+)
MAEANIVEVQSAPAIRVFVSGTFSDFHSERDILMKKVFPLLRAKCRDLHATLVDIDLRWGVPAKTTPSRTVEICMSELSRCREENDSPFMIVLLGERYGWIPTDEDIRALDSNGDPLAEQYGLESGRSITHHEINFGALVDTNPNAFFFMRDSSVFDHPAFRTTKRQWTDLGANAQSLTALKKEIQETFPKEQVMTYACEYAANAASSSSQFLQLTKLEQFEAAVTERLWNAIEHYLQQVMEERGHESKALQAPHKIALEKNPHFVGRDAFKQSLKQAMLKDPTRAVMVTGGVGCGKSALLAHTLADPQFANNTISYFKVSDSPPTALHVVTTLCQQLVPFLKANQTAKSSPLLAVVWNDMHSEQLIEHFAKLLDLWASSQPRPPKGQPKKKLFIVVENMERLSEEAATLRWLPDQLPSLVVLVVGTSKVRAEDASQTGLAQRLWQRCVGSGSEGISVAASQHSDWLRVIDVPDLNKHDRAELVGLILSEYNKELAPEQMEVFITKAEAGSPLYILMACTELRVGCGSFEHLDTFISTLAETTPQLCDQILQRLEAEHSFETISVCLSFLAIAHDSLHESELRDLCAAILFGGKVQRSHRKRCKGLLGKGEESVLASDDTEPPVFPGAQWGYLMLTLEPVISRVERVGEGVTEGALRITRREMRAAILERYGREDDPELHECLFAYFLPEALLDSRTLLIGLHHLSMSGPEHTQTLFQHISHPFVFACVWLNSVAHADLYRYWRACGGYQLAAQTYITTALSLEKATQPPQDTPVHTLDDIVDNLRNLNEKDDIRRYLHQFLRGASLYEQAGKVLEVVLHEWDNGSIVLVSPEPLQGELPLVERVLAKLPKLGDDNIQILLDDLAEYGECLRKVGKYQVASQVIASTLAATSKLNQQTYGSHVLLLSLRRCELLTKTGEYDEALRGYQAALKRLTTSRDSRLEAELLENMGELQRKLGRLPEARSLFMRAIELKEALEGPAACWKLQGNLGEVCFKESEFDKCRGLYLAAYAGVCEYFGADSLDASKMLTNLGELELKLSLLSDAEEHLKQSIAIKRRLQGSTHPDIAKPLNLIGEVYFKRGEYEIALENFSEALELREVALGVGNVECAKILNNIGEVQLQLGDLEGAEYQFKSAASIWEDAYGPDHTYVAKATNNLGEVLKKMGNYEDALTNFQSALRIRELVLGEDHVDTAKVLSNVALMYHKLNKLDMAERRYRRVHEIMLAKLGPNHPTLAGVKFRMAKLEVKLGNWPEARTLFEQALEIRLQSFGPNHVDVAEVQNGLAELLFKLGLADQAEPMYRKSLALRTELLPENHPDTAEVLNNMGEMFLAQKRFSEARDLFDQALHIRQKGRKPEQWVDCTETAKVLNNLGILCAATGDKAAAAPLLMRALKMRERVLGNEHPDLSKVLKNIGVFLDSASPEELKLAKLGDMTSLKIRKYYDRALAIRLRSFGRNHPQVCECLLPLATHHIKHGQPYLAERLLHNAVDIRIRAFGLGHADTLDICHSLLQVYRHQGKTRSLQKFLGELVAQCDEKEGIASPVTQRWVAEYVDELLQSGRTAALKKFLLVRKKSLELHLHSLEQQQLEDGIVDNKTLETVHQALSAIGRNLADLAAPAKVFSR